MIAVGGAGSRMCPACQAKQPVNTALEYRYFHLFWTFGFIATRRYHFACSRCGRKLEARSPRLKKMVTAGSTRLIPLGPVFLIFLGGALLLLGPGDYSE